jgi:hypothetical protein
MANLLNPVGSKAFLKEYYVTIDSIDRDRAVWPLSSRFEVKFAGLPDFAGATVGRGFKNVSSVELVSVVYPNTNYVLNEPCLYIGFDEFEGVYDGTNNAGANAFAKLIPNTALGGFVSSYGDAGSSGHPQRRVSWSSGIRLDKLTVSLKTSRNTIFNFGADYTPDLPANPALQVSITLKVTVVEPYVI